MTYREIKVYMDDVIINSKKGINLLIDIKKFFKILRKYNLKLNLAKYVFRVPTENLLGFIVSCRGIKLYPTKIRAT